MTTAPTITPARKTTPRTPTVRKTSLRALVVAAHLERSATAPRPRHTARKST
ncbi:hypothetical protein ACRYCC_09810 [Actinomadura scrupuli]|uniref:hypothetical protein n=1 Tax=Actinomadura scrupuli TaxID=559629 RepID=UPI003D95A6D4